MRGGTVTKRWHSPIWLGLAAAALAAAPGQARAQSELAPEVERARAAWLAHDAGALVQHSDTVRLRLPGIAESASVRPEQAARLLGRYFDPCEERSFELVGVRELAADHAYAEVARVYVVRGTDEEIEETVFMGFRLIEGNWSLREVRITR
jgi:hypothetical protein